MMGVDYELFWTLNPKSLSPFIKAFVLKRKYDDSIAWQIGAYVRLAIASNFSKNSKYPDEPFSSKASKGNEVMPIEEIKNRFLNHARAINSKFERKEETSG